MWKAKCMTTTTRTKTRDLQFQVFSRPNLDYFYEPIPLHNKERDERDHDNPPRYAVIVNSLKTLNTDIRIIETKDDPANE